MATDLEIAQLICTRVCHDLAGPVGAISAGIELMGDDPEMVDAESLALIAGSASAANHKIKFLRIVLGSCGSGGVSLDILPQAFSHYLAATAGRSGTLKVTWFADAEYAAIADQFNDAAAQILANVLLLAVEAVPGALHLTCRGPGDHGFVCVEAAGAVERNLPIRQDLLDVISGSSEEQLSPRTIQAFVAKRLAESAGSSLQALPVNGGVQITVSAATG